jgi:hypothetical protein
MYVALGSYSAITPSRLPSLMCLANSSDHLAWGEGRECRARPALPLVQLLLAGGVLRDRRVRWRSGPPARRLWWPAGWFSIALAQAAVAIALSGAGNAAYAVMNQTGAGEDGQQLEVGRGTVAADEVVQGDTGRKVFQDEEPGGYVGGDNARGKRESQVIGQEL